jgi:hypothetical protein
MKKKEKEKKYVTILANPQSEQISKSHLMNFLSTSNAASTSNASVFIYRLNSQGEGKHDLRMSPNNRRNHCIFSLDPSLKKGTKWRF